MCAQGCAASYDSLPADVEPGKCPVIIRRQEDGDQPSNNTRTCVGIGVQCGVGDGIARGRWEGLLRCAQGVPTAATGDIIRTAFIRRHQSASKGASAPGEVCEAVTKFWRRVLCAPVSHSNTSHPALLRIVPLLLACLDSAAVLPRARVLGGLTKNGKVDSSRECPFTPLRSAIDSDRHHNIVRHHSDKQPFTPSCIAYLNTFTRQSSA